MNMKHIAAGMLTLTTLLAQPLSAQHDTRYASEDLKERGWYDRPWLRYEAEDGTTNGTRLAQSFKNIDLQSEATNQQAVTLGNGQYVEWTVDNESANALTLRFSLPDNATFEQNGTGTTTQIAVAKNGTQQTVYFEGQDTASPTLSSYWSWQYFTGSGSDNEAHNRLVSSGFQDEGGNYIPIYRMRFDEVVMVLNAPVAKGDKIRITNSTANPLTIDFIELEQTAEVAYDDITGDKVQYTGTGSDLADFIKDNLGKTIYLPKGRYRIPDKISVSGDSKTTLQGAGLFYTELFYTSNPNTDDYPWKRGLTSKLNLKGLHLNSMANWRYLRNTSDDKQASQKNIDKGLSGTWNDCVIEDVLIEHFECGGWISSPKNARFERVRIRNNFADGINFNGTGENSKILHSSFRNNGDDDMAIWSSQSLSKNFEFGYNTSECNWRASAIGVFGGENHRAHHCLIIDPIESGLRATSEYSGARFSDEGFIEFSDISVYNAGSVNASVWKWSPFGSIHINLANNNYSVQNVIFKDIDLHNNKASGIYVAGKGSTLKDGKDNLPSFCLENINVDRYGVSEDNSKAVLIENMYYKGGGIRHSGFIVNGTSMDGLDDTGLKSNGWQIPGIGEKYLETYLFRIKNEVCNTAAIEIPRADGTPLIVNIDGGSIIVEDATSETIGAYNLIGQRIRSAAVVDGVARLDNLGAGVYILDLGETRLKVLVP